MKKLILSLACIAVALIIALPAHAHYVWFNINQAQAKPDTAIGLDLGFGHSFESKDKCPTDRLGKVRAMDPAGKWITLAAKADGSYELAPAAKGCYLASAVYGPGFVTKTPSGYKRQDKRGLAEAISCFSFDLRAKALLPVSGAAGYDSKLGDPLEIIPQADPASLAPGKTLPVLVLFKGKPLAGAKVQATYAGFSTKKDTFAWEGTTDAKGLAQVALKAKGPQLITVGHKIPFPEPDRCDNIRFKYSLNFILN